MNNDLEGIVRTKFAAIFRNFHGGAEEYDEVFHVNRCLGRYSNTSPPEGKSYVLPLDPTCSLDVPVCYNWIFRP